MANASMAMTLQQSVQSPQARLAEGVTRSFPLSRLASG
jgi:hypothetical protein